MTGVIARLLLLASISVQAAEGTHKDWITVSGHLRDTFHDPTDALYLFAYVQTTNGPYYTVRQKNDPDEIDRIEHSVGAWVTVCGRLVPCEPSFSRLYSGRELRIQEADCFQVLKPAPADPFSSPNEDSLWRMTPDNIATQSFHCIRGVVLVAWDRNNVLIRTGKGRIVDAELRSGTLPHCGETIDIVGLPETTLYNLHLNRAIWRSVAPPGNPGETITSLHAEKIVTDEQGHPRMDLRQHGKTLRMAGIVRSLPKPGLANDLLYLDDNGFTVPVNADAAQIALKDVQIGCHAEVTGVCVMNVDIWRPNAVFPRVRGYTVITRSPDDIRVLSHPPWLTPRRMTAVVAILAAGLLAILSWTYALRVKSERRGRQLAREQLRHAEADLKVQERTRLAVELHDALSQNLAGVALQLKTVAALADADPKAARERLAIADRSLLSCREDLRNCLHDLRSDALEEKTMDAAIRKALAPHVDEATVTVRFNMPRESFSEKSAHALICIVRELTVNAIRHGKASAVKVAGAAEGGKLLVSVRDNGCGFDPATRPGVREGHFGLQGVQERILALGGHFALDSTPGNGTRASFSINLPPTETPAHG